MMSLTQIAASVGAAGAIGASALTLDHLHVSSESFKEYIDQQIQADERAYVQELKKNIREVTGSLLENPDEVYLIEALASLVDELCEIRPDDRLCDDASD